MFQLSDDGLKYIKTELQRYETKESAIIPALFEEVVELARKHDLLSRIISVSMAP